MRNVRHDYLEEISRVQRVGGASAGWRGPRRPREVWRAGPPKFGGPAPKVWRTGKAVEGAFTFQRLLVVPQSQFLHRYDQLVKLVIIVYLRTTLYREKVGLRRCEVERSGRDEILSDGLLITGPRRD
jgi:hypothetical protein